jgi:hypothetical protein
LRNIDAGSSAYLRNSLRFNTVEDAASDAVYAVRGSELQPARMNMTARGANGRTSNRRKRLQRLTISRLLSAFQIRSM